MDVRRRLKKAQREALIAWVAEGLETDEINERAATFPRPFKVSRALVAHYRRTRGVAIEAAKQAGESAAITAALADKAVRVAKLQQLADRIEEDLLGDRLWVEDVKMIGSGPFSKEVEFERFNASEVAAYRGILDDIAREQGDRKAVTRLESDGPLFKVYQGIDPDKV